jgi:HAD superfamily hydrolase (TIGR01509 family)
LNDFERILTAAGLPVKRPALDNAYDASGAYLGRVWSTRRDVPVQEHVRAILNAVDPSLGDRLTPSLVRDLVEAYSRPILIVPPSVDVGARAALEALRARGHTLALVSNTMRTPGVTLRKLLGQFGLLDCFAHTTFSDEVLIRKPDPAIFALTLRAVGGEPATAVHVGDDAVLDVQGGRAAGMRVIQVAPKARSGVGLGPDAIIPRLAALPGAVAELEAR